MKLRFFDFEVTPNWWLCVFGDLEQSQVNSFDENIKDTFMIVNSDMPNARNILMDYMRDTNTVKLGYNIKGYDLIIANGIYQGFTPQQIKIINDIIINPSSAWKSKEAMRLEPFAKKKLSNIVYQDLMDDTTGSLKEKEATLGLNVLESDVDFNKEDMTFEDKESMTYYCKQDVYAAMKYYQIVYKPYVETKLHMGEKFHIPEDVCYKSTNAKLVGLALKAKRTTFADEDRQDIELPNKIKAYCEENLRRDVLTKILNSTAGFKIKLFENEVSFGNGGIHSVWCGQYATAPCVFVAEDEDWMLVNVDAGSYYPSMMIQFNLLSRAVQNPQIFTDIYDERMAIKHKKDKTVEDEKAQKADKLVLNTTFGASGNKYLELYDPYMCSKICRTGQIFLAALACRIVNKIKLAKIIQTNTDGILVYLPRKDFDVLQYLMKEWSDVSGINMEPDIVKAIWQRDVNNYLMIIDEHGKEKVKCKGGWLNDSYLRPGSVKLAAANAFVCSKAIIAYLSKGEDIIENIANNKNLQDFCITCTKGPTYRGCVQRMTDGKEVQLFKANRVIASKDQSLGLIYKYKMFKGEIRYAKMPSIPEHSRLMNDDLSHYDFNKIKKDIDYMWYIERCSEMLDMQWVHLDGCKVEITNKFDYFAE